MVELVRLANLKDDINVLSEASIKIDAEIERLQAPRNRLAEEMAMIQVLLVVHSLASISTGALLCSPGVLTIILLDWCFSSLTTCYTIGGFCLTKFKLMRAMSWWQLIF